MRGRRELGRGENRSRRVMQLATSIAMQVRRGTVGHGLVRSLRAMYMLEKQTTIIHLVHKRIQNGNGCSRLNVEFNSKACKCIAFNFELKAIASWSNLLQV